MPLATTLDGLRVLGSYGVFRVMTKTRPEIMVEGSNDGVTWTPYEFKWKPGRVDRRPQFIAPWQPRLDWQMWFAALSSPQQNPWFSRLIVRLLDGQTEVINLLAENPFPDKPPRFIRAEVYDYHFTDWSTRRSTGAVWSRTPLGEYFPVVSLR